MKFLILATLSAIVASMSTKDSEEVSSQPSGTKRYNFNDTALGDGPDSCDFSRMTVHNPYHVKAITAHPQFIRCEAKKAAEEAAKKASEEAAKKASEEAAKKAAEESAIQKVSGRHGKHTEGHKKLDLGNCPRIAVEE